MKSASRPVAFIADNLMTRKVITLRDGDSLDHAAQLFAKEQISGAPVVDDEGRCIGLLSLADLVRWAEQQGNLMLARATPLPRTCSYQTNHRDRFGKEIILCTLPTGACPFQQDGKAPDGSATILCGQPFCVPTDWQVVTMTESSPRAVRDFMTTDLVIAHSSEPIIAIAQKMIDAHIHRIVIVDKARRPVGIVSSMDCMAAMVREHHARETTHGTNA